MRTRRTLATLTMGVGAAVASCSIVTSFDGLTGGQGSDAGVVDALPSVDSAQLDAGADAPVLDAATEAADPDAGSWCARHPSQFCVDFDQPPSILAGWDDLLYPFGDAAAATIALDGLSYVSGPSSALVKLPPGPNCRFAGLTRSVAVAAKEVHLAYDLRMTSAVGHQGTVLAFDFPRWNCTYFVAQSNTGSTYVYEQAFEATTERSSAAHDLSKSIVAGVWSRIELDLVLSGTAQTLAVRLDGTQVLSPTPVLADCRANLANGTPSKVYLRLGFHCQTNAVELRHDNVTLDLK